jgi:hypothetical protein
LTTGRAVLWDADTQVDFVLPAAACQAEWRRAGVRITTTDEVVTGR